MLTLNENYFKYESIQRRGTTLIIKQDLWVLRIKGPYPKWFV